MDTMLKQILDSMWEELYYEGEKFLKEREGNHLHNVKNIAKTIYYIRYIEKKKEEEE